MIRRTAQQTRTISSPPPPGRGGVSLTEVLMSLLVLGVGVSSLAVLFPLAILRSIDSTQLTSATIHRYNAEELIDSFPQLVFDPDISGNAAGHANTNYIVDPLGEVILTTQPADPPGMPMGPAVLFGGVLPRFRGSLTPMTLIAPFAAADIVTSPDSWETLLGKDRDELLSGFNNGTPGPPPTSPSINMEGAFKATERAADYAAAPGELVYRAIFFDATGQFSHTRILTNIDANVLTNDADDTLTWTDPLPRIDTDADGVLDADFTPAAIWLQVQEQHYSWLLTVRREASTIIEPGPPLITDEIAAIDVVVFFNRPVNNTAILSNPPNGNGTYPAGPYDPLAENAYPLEGRMAGGVFEGGFRKGIDEVTIDWGANPKPFLKEGKFIFDPENARWYRILSVTELSATRALIKLDRGADADSVMEDAANNQKGLGVFMEGIVDIYPIKNKTGRFSTP